MIGDVKSPKPEHYDVGNFVSYRMQVKGKFSKLATLIPDSRYSRKNIGYLMAAYGQKKVPDYIVETDDDNLPYASFYAARHEAFPSKLVKHCGWYNVYNDFTQHGTIWPRGFPLQFVKTHAGVSQAGVDVSLRYCPIQQGLANTDPDVDAVYRMTQSLPVRFLERTAVALDAGCWCPFNSQNTTFFRSAYPLMYLPSFCSFRMTDIWRSFVAQRCLWAAGRYVGFTSPTVEQKRNDHDLLKDFEEEIPGYLRNNEIKDILLAVKVEPVFSGATEESHCRNLRRCYEALVQTSVLPKKELKLVDAWIEAIAGALRG